MNHCHLCMKRCLGKLTCKIQRQGKGENKTKPNKQKLHTHPKKTKQNKTQPNKKPTNQTNQTVSYFPHMRLSLWFVILQISQLLQFNSKSSLVHAIAISFLQNVSPINQLFYSFTVISQHVTLTTSILGIYICFTADTYNSPVSICCCKHYSAAGVLPCSKRPISLPNDKS